jgi:hypothetical protein
MQLDQTLYEASSDMNTQDAPLRCSELLMIFQEKLISRPKNTSLTLAYDRNIVFQSLMQL